MHMMADLSPIDKLMALECTRFTDLGFSWVPKLKWFGAQPGLEEGAHNCLVHDGIQGCHCMVVVMSPGRKKIPDSLDAIVATKFRLRLLEVIAAIIVNSKSNSSNST